MLAFAMQFNVAGLVQEGLGATRRHEVSGYLVSEDHGRERLTGSVELLCTRSGVLVRADLRLVEAQTCSRCLQPCEEVLSIGFEEEFLATVDARTGHAVSERPDGDAFLIDEYHVLDLGEAVRQYREAAARIQPLCRPDCRGLCPSCGRDLNLGDCGCNGGAVDGRWAGLAALLREDDETEDRLREQSLRPASGRSVMKGAYAERKE